jgi:hypothetical protein
MRKLESPPEKSQDVETVGQALSRASCILEHFRDEAGRSEEGRIWAILATEADKLLALAIGFGAADRPLPLFSWADKQTPAQEAPKVGE